jgi:hypothetical protein
MAVEERLVTPEGPEAKGTEVTDLERRVMDILGPAASLGSGTVIL